MGHFQTFLRSGKGASPSALLLCLNAKMLGQGMGCVPLNKILGVLPLETVHFWYSLLLI